MVPLCDDSSSILLMYASFDQTPRRSLLATRGRFFFFSASAFLLGHYVAHLGVIPLLYWFVTLPGTFLHELAHYVMALLLNGQPSGFSILPTWENGSMASLGHVLSVPTWYNAAPVSLAPLLLFPLTLFFVWRAAYSTQATHTLAWLYFGVCAWSSCVPSSQDFSVAWSYPLSFLFAFVLLFGVFKLAWRFHVKQFNGLTR